MTHLVHVRFDRIVTFSDKNCDQTGFARADLPVVPLVGETVNIDGHPYVTLERGWSLDSEEPRKIYAYLRMLPAMPLFSVPE